MMGKSYKPNHGRISDSKDRQKILAELPSHVRERLRREIIKGAEDDDAATTAGCDKDHARAMRQRLREMDVIPAGQQPRVKKQPVVVVDPRQLPLPLDDAS